MRVQEHGGECCGVTHILGFHENNGFYGYPTTPEGLVALIRDDLEDGDYDYDPDHPLMGHLFEAILTDRQPAKYHKMLTDYGFKEVNAFKNSNSGNVCRVYHYIA